MSYRHPESDPEICGVPTDMRIHILNGTTLEVLLTCNYKVPPVPPATEETLRPIHLPVEGYGEPIVAFSPVIVGLTGSAYVDPVDDNVVHVVFNAVCPSAVDVDDETEVSVLITRGEAPAQHTDCILRGRLEVEDAPLPLPV